MRPVRQIRDELMEAGLTVSAAAPEGAERSEVELMAGEAIRRRYEELGPDEQEALRVDLAVPEGASADDVALAVLDRGRAEADETG